MMFKCLARFRQSLSSLEKTKSGSARGVAEFNRAKFCFFFNSCQPCPKAFSARSVLDSTVSCDVTEKDSPALSQTSRGQLDNEARERLGTGLNNCILS